MGKNGGRTEDNNGSKNGGKKLFLTIEGREKRRHERGEKGKIMKAGKGKGEKCTLEIYRLIPGEFGWTGIRKKTIFIYKQITI